MPFATKQASGFTLLELIATIAIISVLAVVAVSRLGDTSAIDQRGFYDETMAALRYAQKAAVAQRRNVCVTFSATSVTLGIAATPGAATACTLGLTSPTGTTPFSVSARNTASFAGVPQHFQFNSLGQAVPVGGGAALTQSIAFAGFPLSFTIEGETGYVHP